MNTHCQPDAGGAEVDATLEPIIFVGLESKGGSWITKGTLLRGGRGPKGASLGRSIEFVVSRGLLRPR